MEIKMFLYSNKGCIVTIINSVEMATVNACRENNMLHFFYVLIHHPLQSSLIEFFKATVYFTMSL